MLSPPHDFSFADILRMVDALPVGVMVMNPVGKVLHVNHKMETLSGFSVTAAQGMPCRHILRGRPCVSGCSLGCNAFSSSVANTRPALSGEAASAFLMEMSRMAGTDGLIDPIIKELETDILTLKKRRIPVRLTHFPVLDVAGTALFLLDVVEDLTELKTAENSLQQAHGHGKLVGRSAAMERITTVIPGIAPSLAPVLLTGETGTGKDILAEVLHQASSRSREPFIRLNVSPLPEALLEPEIFGHTSPDAPIRPGRFQQAAGGTLYITELADIPQGIQRKLLHFLDTGNILPVGGLRETTANVRLITATNRDPDELVRRGFLLNELFYRLNVAHIALPPLRERMEDIEFLLRHFLDQYAVRFKKRFDGFTAEARSLLASYGYPGNVRELKNIVEYAAMVCPEALIGIDMLPAHLVQRSAPKKEYPAAPSATPKQGKRH